MELMFSRRALRKRAAAQTQARLQSRFYRPSLELLERRSLLAFNVVGVEIAGSTPLKLVVDFDQPVDVSSVAVTDLVIDGTLAATSFSAADADTIEFTLPARPERFLTANLKATRSFRNRTRLGRSAFSKERTDTQEEQIQRFERTSPPLTSPPRRR
jgi:hypothetical protein